jgi:hypothetical protein
MSYQLKLKKEPAYLFVQVTGIRTLETVLAAGKEVILACDEQGYNRVLVDVQEMTGELTTFEVYDLGTGDLKEFRRPGQLKMAILDLEENRSRFRFFETVFHNRGYNLRIFSNMDEAIKWLREGE